MATEDLTVTDLNQDGLPDIIAVGHATHNVKIYLNQRGRELESIADFGLWIAD